MTIGELKALVKDLPDDERVECYSGRMDSLVDFDIEYMDSLDDYGGMALVIDGE